MQKDDETGINVQADDNSKSSPEVKFISQPQSKCIEEFHDSNCSILDSSDDNISAGDYVTRPSENGFVEADQTEPTPPIVLEIPHKNRESREDETEVQLNKIESYNGGANKLKIGLVPVQEEVLPSPGNSKPNIEHLADSIMRSQSNEIENMGSGFKEFTENHKNIVEQTPRFEDPIPPTILMNRFQKHTSEIGEQKLYLDCTKLTPLVTELQSELSTKDRQLAEYRDLLKAISFGDVESPRFRRQSSKINHSLEDTALKAAVSDKVGEVTHRDGGCVICSELKKLTIELQNENLESDDKLRVLRQENLDLKLELTQKIEQLNELKVKSDDPIQIIRTKVDEESKGKEDEKLGLRGVRSDDQKSINTGFLKIELPGEEDSTTKNLLLKNIEEETSNFKEQINLLQEKSKRFIENQKGHMATISKLKETLQQERTYRHTIEKVFYGEIRSLEKKYSELSQKLAENIVDKGKLIDLLCEYEGKYFTKDESNAEVGQEFGKLKQKSHDLEILNSKLKHDIEALKREVEKRTEETTSLKKVNLEQIKIAHEESEKLKKCHSTIEEKTSEISNLNYRLQSVFDLLKKKQQDEEEASSNLKSMLSRIKEAMSNENQEIDVAPESFGKINRSMISQNAPLSFFSHKSKSETEFDHKDMATLYLDLETAVQDLLCQSSHLKLLNRDLERKIEMCKKECSKFCEENASIDGNLKEQQKTQERGDKVDSNKADKKGSYGAEQLQEGEGRESHSELGRQTQSFRDSLQRLDFGNFGTKDVDHHRAGSVMSLEGFHSSPNGRKSPCFGGNMKNYQFPLFENSSERLIELKQCLKGCEDEKAKQESSTVDKETCTDDLICQEISNIEKELPKPLSVQNQVGGLFMEEVVRDQEGVQAAAFQDALQVNSDPKYMTGGSEDGVEQHRNKQLSEEKIKEQESFDLELGESPDYDWRSALWKCYLASINNECDENSEHLKISELVPYVIEKINSLHSKIASLTESNNSLTESVMRKDNRLERLIEETNQAEEIINELLQKCDKLEKEVAQYSKAEEEKIPELTVSDFLNNITTEKKDGHDGNSDDLNKKVECLEEKVDSLNRLNRAQGRVLDSLVKEIVAYQSILKSDKVRDESVELSLSILSKILRVLDGPTEGKLVESENYEQSLINQKTEKSSEQEFEPRRDLNLKSESCKDPVPNFGVMVTHNVFATSQNLGPPEISMNTNSQERSKSIRQIREQVEAQKTRIQQLSSEMSSRKQAKLLSVDGSPEISPCRNLLVHFNSSKANEKDQKDKVQLTRQYGSESNVREPGLKCKFDSVQPARLLDSQSAGLNHFPKKLLPYPEQHFSLTSSDDELLPTHAIQDPETQARMQSMANTIKLLKERADQNITKIKLLEDNQASLQNELDSKNKENKELQKQLSLHIRDKCKPPKAIVPSEITKSPSRSVKSTKKVGITEPENKKNIPNNEESYKQRWSIKLLSKTLVEDNQDVLDDTSLIYSPLSVRQKRGISRSTTIVDNQNQVFDTKSSQRGCFAKDGDMMSSSACLFSKVEKIERGLTAIQMKLMELINKKYALITPEAQSIHRDLTMHMDEISRMISDILAEETEIDETFPVLARCFQKIDLVGSRAKELGKVYSDLDEAAVGLVKRLNGKSRNPGLVKVKEYIRTSEWDKARVLADHIAKSGKVARDRQVASLNKAVESTRQDWISLQTMVQGRKFKLDQICTAFGERLDELLPLGCSISHLELPK
jgi:hypothetical protein